MRPKPFLTYFLLCAIPLFLLAALNYWNGARSVDSTVSTIAQSDLNAFSGAVNELLDENQKSILQFAIAPSVRELITRTDVTPSGPADLSQLPNTLLTSLPRVGPSFHYLSLYGRSKIVLWFQNDEGNWLSTSGFGFKGSPVIPKPDERVWAQQGNVSFEQADTQSPTLTYSVPIHDEKGTAVVGAAAATVDLASVFSDASRGLQTKSNPRSMVVVLDRSGNTLYHSDRSLERQPINQSLPGFNSIASAMMANQSGVDQYHSPAGTNYQVAYAPLPRLNATVAIARNNSAPSNAGRWGIAGFVLALLASLIAAFVLER